MNTVEIICNHCRADSLLKREPVYTGFTRTGEKLLCANCGHEYASEAEVRFKVRNDEPQIFTEADRSMRVEVFNEGENSQLCRYCANYIVNPFTQFCSLHKKEVQATDSCPQFQLSEKKDDTEGLL